MSVSTSRHPNSSQSVASFFAAVRRSARREGPVDPEILRPAAAVTTSSSEGVGSDGGYLVPPAFQTALSDAVLSEDNWLGRCSLVETQRNSITIPVDEQSAFSSSGIGVKPELTAEGQALTQSLMKIGSRSLRLSKLSIFAGVSNELLEDSGPALDAYLVDVASQRFNFLINSYCLTGDGVDKPLGFLSQPCAISVAAEGSQTSQTVNILNLQKLYARLIPAYRGSAFWIMHSSVEQALPSIVGSAGSVFLNYVNGQAFVLGIPVVSSEAASAIGTVGDVTLLGGRGIIIATKPGLIKRQLSTHVGWDQDRSAFRFDLRFAMSPLLRRRLH